MTVNYQDHYVLSAPNNIGYNQEWCLLLLPVEMKFRFLYVPTGAKKLFGKVKLEIRLRHLAGIKSLSDFKNSYTYTKEKKLKEAA